MFCVSGKTEKRYLKTQNVKTNKNKLYISYKNTFMYHNEFLNGNKKNLKSKYTLIMIENVHLTNNFKQVYIFKVSFLLF